MKRREGFRPYSKKPSRLFMNAKICFFLSINQEPLVKKNVTAFRD